MRKLTLNLNVRGKNAVLMLNPSSFVWQSKYKFVEWVRPCSICRPSSLPPFHPLRLAARSAAPARLVHQGQLPSSSLGVSARTSLGALSLARPAPRACPRPIRRRNRPSQFGKTNTHSTVTAAPSRPLASAYDPAAQQPAQGSTMQAGAVGGVGGLGGRWRCSSGPRYLERRVPSLFVNGPSVVCFASPARTPLCSTTQAAIGRTAAHDGRARRCVWRGGGINGGQVRPCAKSSPFVVSQGRSVGWARAGGAPPRERTGRRPCDNPKGLEPRRWPCTRGVRQSGGGRRAERGGEPRPSQQRRYRGKSS